MKSLLTLIIAISLSAVATTTAQLQDIQISVVRQKLDEQKSRQDGDTTIRTQDVGYKITVENKTFKAIPKLVVKYMIFYSKPEFGSSEVVDTFKKGSKTIDGGLDKHRSTMFETTPFKLTSAELDGGVSWINGADRKAKDRITGIWVRAISDGKIVGEYVNPASLAKKNDFKE